MAEKLKKNQVARKIFKPIIMVAILVALLNGAFLFSLSLLSGGFEWWISEINTEIIYSAILKYKDFPFFSYYHNGGSMIIQDPQGHLLSPATPLILIFGPQIGLRLMTLVWGFIGCLSAFYWLRSKVGDLAALFSASAWALSMVFIWHIVVGNDMFIWHLGLPLFLIAIEKTVLKPSWKVTSLSALLVAIYILGPSLHSLVYLIIPTSIIWFIFLFVKNYKDINKKQLLIHCLAIIVIGVTIALPKINAWLLLDMSRDTVQEGSILFDDALQSLLDVRPSRGPLRYTQENVLFPFFSGNVALQPIASIIAIIGLIFGWRKKNKKTKIFWFALTLLLTGILISTAEPIWVTFRWITQDSFRAPARFLAISAFGLAILAGIGTASILEYIPKLKTVIAGLLIASTFIIGIIWINQATSVTMPSFSIQAGFTRVNTKIVTGPLTSLSNFNISSIKTEYTNNILSDLITYTDVPIVGSGAKKVYLKQRLKIFAENGGQYYLSPELAPDGRIRVYHTSITAKDLQPEEIAHIRLNPAPLGETIHTTPENANVTLEIIDDELVLTNHENYAIEMVEIKPNSPVHPAIWIISII
ncbi:MAG: hypothetical protein Q8P20_05755, partial [bacterium]|nr:hypothetical protein [bacterium]